MGEGCLCFLPSRVYSISSIALFGFQHLLTISVWSSLCVSLSTPKTGIAHNRIPWRKDSFISRSSPSELYLEDVAALFSPAAEDSAHEDALHLVEFWINLL